MAPGALEALYLQSFAVGGGLELPGGALNAATATIPITINGYTIPK